MAASSDFFFFLMLYACVWGREKSGFRTDRRYDLIFARKALHLLPLLSHIKLLFANDAHLIYNNLVYWVEIVIHLSGEKTGLEG